MPRNDKKVMAKSNSIWPNGLRFIASLLFLYVIFGAGASSGWWSPWITTGAGSLWLPIVFGVAVLSTIGLFFCSLAGLAYKKPNMMITKIMMVASLMLVILTVSPAWTGTFWIVILGFILGWIGSAIEMM
jgi:hypothetical protein